MNKPFVRVLGSADWRPTAGNDHSCYTLSDTALIDCCAGVITHLLGRDVDPTQMHYVFFTHMHADHYMGLGPLLHYWRVRFASLENLTLIGPKAYLRSAYGHARTYAFHDSPDLYAEIKQDANLVELEGNCSFDFEGWHADVMDSVHAVPGLCYRFTHNATGRSVGFTGDTQYQPAFAQFFKNVDLLLHECSFGGGPLPEFNKVCGHSSAIEAVRVCREAEVKRMLLTHTYEPNRGAALRVAYESLNIPVEWAMPGKVFEI